MTEITISENRKAVLQTNVELVPSHRAGAGNWYDSEAFALWLKLARHGQKPEKN